MRYTSAMHIEAACGFRGRRFSLRVDGSGLRRGRQRHRGWRGKNDRLARRMKSPPNWRPPPTPIGKWIKGLSFVAINALIMRRYLHEYGWTKNDFAAFSINAHANGAHNPNARFQEPISEAITPAPA